MLNRPSGAHSEVLYPLARGSNATLASGAFGDRLSFSIAVRDSAGRPSRLHSDGLDRWLTAKECSSEVLALDWNCKSSSATSKRSSPKLRWYVEAIEGSQSAPSPERKASRTAADDDERCRYRQVSSHERPEHNSTRLKNSRNSTTIA